MEAQEAILFPGDGDFEEASAEAARQRRLGAITARFDKDVFEIYRQRYPDFTPVVRIRGAILGSCVTHLIQECLRHGKIEKIIVDLDQCFINITDSGGPENLPDRWEVIRHCLSAEQLANPRLLVLPPAAG